MTFFDQIYQMLFATDQHIQVKEVLERTRNEKIIFARWCQNPKTPEFLGHIFKNYHYYKSGITSQQLDIHLLDSVGANGFALIQHQSFDKYALICLMEWIKSKILAKNYNLQSAERHISDKKTFVETLERYYFKPDIHAQAMAGEICNQQFGNITLEYIKTDNKPQYLKIMASFYQDRLFTTVLSFDELCAYLFREEK
jgi:hypothetical protein